MRTESLTAWQAAVLKMTVLIFFGLFILLSTGGQSLMAFQESATSDSPSSKQKASPSEQVGEDAVVDELWEGERFVNPVRNRWRVGVQLKGGSRSARNLLVTIPVPNQWPEQNVTLYEENIPAEVQSVRYRDLNSGVRQLVATIPILRANQLVELTVTFDVETRQIEPPSNPESLQIPDRLPRDIREYTGVSPQISYRNSKLRSQVKELVEAQPSAWKKVRALFDWIDANIEYSGEDPTDTVQVFRQRSGSSEDLVGLFVAMCRAAKVPARMVWVEGAQYAEFYLVDRSGAGYWFPCQVAGRREFGGNREPRVILQKGDNIKVPEKKARQKFCAEFVTGSGKAKPRYRFIRELLPAN